MQFKRIYVIETLSLKVSIALPYELEVMIMMAKMRRMMTIMMTIMMIMVMIMTMIMVMMMIPLCS